MVVLCLAGHFWATCHTLPLSTVWKYPILPYNDFAVHAHRAGVFREAFRRSGDTWGCDPAVCGGDVLHPTQEVGSWIYEAAAVLLPRVETGRLVTAIVWCAVLIAPLFLLGAGRLLDFDTEQIAWGLLLADGFLWLDPAHCLLLYVGMAAFLLASYVCLFVLALYDRFLRGPTALGYAGVVLAASLLFFVHPFGPVAILPALLWLIVRAPGVRRPWRLATLITPLPIAALNAFWLTPVLAGLHSSPPPWRTTLNLQLPYWTWRDWNDFLVSVPPLLMVGLGVLLVTSGVGLFAVARRRSPVTVVALGLTLLVSLLLFLFASFCPLTRFLQPVRFVAVFLNLTALLTGCAIPGVCRSLRFPGFVSGAIYATVGGALVAAVAFFGQRLTPPQDAVELIDFIRYRTLANDRILLEAAQPYPFLGKILPAIAQREIFSSVFPDLQDPIQFACAPSFGRSAEEWSVDQVREVLARFNVNWAIVRDPPWREFFRKIAGRPGMALGPYEAFALGRDHSRFLVGSGEVLSGVNRLELRNVGSPQDYVVIRYRYHPGWVCDGPGTIEPFPTPDDSGGLLLIRHPAPTTVLRFDPVRALRTPWPAACSARPAPSQGH
jgi:hypothetical protein